MFRQDYTCPALLFVTHRPAFHDGAITRYGRTFQTVPLSAIDWFQLGCSASARHYLRNLG